MKDLLIKYLFLSYHTKIFGKDFYYPRAISVVVPVFLIGVLLTLLIGSISIVFWTIFSALILLTFPIIKLNWINWLTVVLVPLLIGGASIFGYEWWAPLPLLYFGLGILVDRTKFLFFSVKYEDLNDWEQQLRYLKIPYGKKAYDETEPVLEQRKKILRGLEEMEEMKFGASSNVNLFQFFLPITCTIITIILLIVFRDSVTSFPDIRGFDYEHSR